MVNATEATAAMLSRMAVVIALIYRLINSSLVGWSEDTPVTMLIMCCQTELHQPPMDKSVVPCHATGP
jgi:hypothetical protein